MPEEKDWETEEIKEEDKREEGEKVEEAAEEEEKEEKNKEVDKQEASKKSWLSKEGELVVDVYQTDEDIVIQAPIAGISKEDIEIITEKDMITIRGKRNRPSGDEIHDFFIKECYWGSFCREVILPEETDPSRIKATMESSILTIRVPRIEREKRRKVELDEE